METQNEYILNRVKHDENYMKILVADNLQSINLDLINVGYFSILEFNAHVKTYVERIIPMSMNTWEIQKTILKNQITLLKNPVLQITTYIKIDLFNKDNSKKRDFDFICVQEDTFYKTVQYIAKANPGERFYTKDDYYTKIVDNTIYDKMKMFQCLNTPFNKN